MSQGRQLSGCIRTAGELTQLKEWLQQTAEHNRLADDHYRLSHGDTTTTSLGEVDEKYASDTSRNEQRRSNLTIVTTERWLAQLTHKGVSGATHTLRRRYPIRTLAVCSGQQWEGEKTVSPLVKGQQPIGGTAEGLIELENNALEG